MLSRLFLMAVIFAAPPAFAADFLVVDGPLPVQGDCSGLMTVPSDVDPTRSTWSCPGRSETPLHFGYENGAMEACLYIDNGSDPPRGFFIPLNTFSEWSGFKQSVMPPNGALRNDLQFTYGCLAGKLSNSCGVLKDLPDARNDTTVSFTVNQKSYSYTCRSADQCGEWVKTGEEAQSLDPSQNGSCTLDGVTIANGAGHTFFSARQLPANTACADIALVRNCTDGILDGADLYKYAAAAGCDCTASEPQITLEPPTLQQEPAPLDLPDPVEPINPYTVAATPADKSCGFNGHKIANGGKVTAYQAARVPHGQRCFSETRHCHDKTLSGSYRFASCTVALPAMCKFNGQKVAHGTSIVAFQTASVPFGQHCTKQTRRCDNGTLSGTFTKASCSVAAPRACMFNGRSIAHGSGVDAYQTATVPFRQNCAKQTRRCNNGALSGSYTNGSCNVQAPSACSFNGHALAHDDSVVAYQSSSVPFRSPCIKQTRRCSNGVLSGSYTNQSCTVGAPASCTFNGQTIAHGASVPAYATATVPHGQRCSKQTRRCTNGTLSGDFTFSACSVLP